MEVFGAEPAQRRECRRWLRPDGPHGPKIAGGRREIKSGHSRKNRRGHGDVPPPLSRTFLSRWRSRIRPNGASR